MPAGSSLFPRTLAGMIAIAGGFQFILGLTVLVGWYARIPLLIQGLLTLKPVVPTTALAFLLSGTALLALGRGRPGWMRPAAALLLLLGVVTMVEYLVGAELGLSRILVPTTPPEFLQPGRMALNTAIGFSFGAAALLGLTVPHRAGSALAALLSAAVLVLATNALVGYASGVTAAYTWGGLSTMALPSALCLLLLGGGGLLSAWQREQRRSTTGPRWFPALLTAMTLAGALTLAQAVQADQHARLQLATVSEAQHLRTLIAAELTSRVQAIERMASAGGGAAALPESSGRPMRHSMLKTIPAFERLSGSIPALLCAGWPRRRGTRPSGIRI